MSKPFAEVGTSFANCVKIARGDILLAVVGILPKEVELLVNALKPKLEVFEVMKRPAWRGLIGDNEILISCGCVGKVETACLAQKLIDQFKISGLILIGAAGALKDDITFGTLIAGTEYIEYDFTPRINVDLILQPSQVCFTQFMESGDFVYGTIASGDRFVSSEAMAKEIYESTSAICVDMDSAAAAKVCVENGKDFLALKVIVDVVGSKAVEQYIENHPKFGMKPAMVLAEFLTNNFMFCG